MILYIDETENEEIFLVAGLFVETKGDVEIAYRNFKKRIKGFRINPKVKSKVFTEFKSTLLDNDYQRIKVKMLEQLQSLDCQIVFSCHMKTKETFCQNTKESVYISLLTSVVENGGEELEIIFDSFGKADFEAAIIEKVGSLDNVVSIVPGDSEKEHGLQFVDNICSVIRLHKSNDVKDFYYNYVKKDLREV